MVIMRVGNVIMMTFDRAKLMMGESMRSWEALRMNKLTKPQVEERSRHARGTMI